MSIEHLTESVRRQVATKQLQCGPDLSWAELIIAKKAAGARVGVHAYKLATEALASRARQPKP